ncbi:probable palmitoyltransferase ZDHHC24 [Ylistrum balloti]|uniref:probable palmitoyltransferase ZDHHC24 n=1 Tax=Ylistrum balloti TaxID=509963 RepID=UPI002905D758|nr:probable palmitoyltransferase ZDHHC24 [Ylistrum balloti]
MVSLCLVFGRRVPFRVRLMAFGNLFFCFYFALMTLIVTVMCWSQILPDLYMGDRNRIRRHRLCILFTFINAVGNFVLCIFTDTSIKRVTKQKPKDESAETGKLTTKLDGLSTTNEDSLTTQAENSNYKKRHLSKNSHEMAKKRKPHESKGKGEGKAKRDVDKDRNFCDTCHVTPPPRSHHCVLCQTCILKRDHHCFFMTVCVGYFNQKYFVMYCFYMMIGTFYGMFLIVLYLKKLFNVTFHGPQTFLFLLLEMIGKLTSNAPIGLGYIFLVCLMYACLTAGLIAAGLWFWQLQITLTGQTTYEATSVGGGKYSKSKIDNFLEVFGKYWFLTLFIPVPIRQPQYEDTFVKSTACDGNK